MNRSYYNRNQTVTRRQLYNTVTQDTCPCQPVPYPTQTAEDCENMVVAMAYVPWQQWHTVYEADTAFMQGTLFPELDKPWLAGGVNCG